MVVKVFRSNCEGYTIDPATTENPECGYTALPEIQPPLKNAELGP